MIPLEEPTMLILRIPNRSVIPAHFRGGQGICQNLDCLAPLEPPFRTAWLCLPGWTLETVLCAACTPQPSDGTPPEVRLEVVPAMPVLTPADRPGAPPASGLPPANSDPWPTFEELARVEPRLLDLLAEARSHHNNRDADFCALDVWFGRAGTGPSFKKRLGRLVGFAAEQGGVLRTSAAYQVAYRTIYQALPDCRGRCLGLRGRRN
jgi:hypothetical protein